MIQMLQNDTGPRSGRRSFRGFSEERALRLFSLWNGGPVPLRGGGSGHERLPSQEEKVRDIQVSIGRVFALALVAAFGLVACDDDGVTGSDDPDTRPESQLEFVLVDPDAPPLETTDTSFWAVRGEERELEIRFQGSGGSGTGSRFLRFEVDDESLLRRPDGTTFAPGDSIEIRVQVASDRYFADFEPSGLVFNPDDPAELEIRYELADDDFLEREQEFDLWRQERPGDPWQRIGSLQLEDIDEIEAELLGFTRFALAIGR